MKRVTIRGTSGSGKTTLGRALGAKLGVPHVELDEHWHLPGWQERPVEEFRARVAEALSGEGWVVDGNYRKVSELILDRADTVIWLDYPFPITFGRVLKRTLRRTLTRERVCNGNQEEFFKSFFTRDSILWWSLTTHRRRHEQCEAFFADPTYAHLQRLRFRHPRETEKWLQSL
jgi:adenylate kinase family enzyme